MIELHKTLLTLYGMGQSLYSGRGLTQTWKPIGTGSDISRDWNGVVMDFSYDQFRLLATEITCTDVEAAALDNIWQGSLIECDCIFELSHPIGQTPSRPSVGGSERIDVTAGLRFYRPHVELVVMTYSASNEEYAADYNWKLTCEERRPQNMIES